MVLEHLWDLPLNPLHHMNMGLLAYWPEKYLQPLLPLLHQLSLAHKPYLSSSYLTLSICHLPAHQIVLCPKSCCCCLSIFSNTSISIRIISPYTGLCPMNLNAPPGPPSLCCQQQVIFNQITGPNTSYFSPSQRYLLLLLPSLPIKPGFFFLISTAGWEAWFRHKLPLLLHSFPLSALLLSATWDRAIILHCLANTLHIMANTVNKWK